MIEITYLYGNGNRESLKYSSLTSFIFSLNIKHISSNDFPSKILNIEVSTCPKLEVENLVCILKAFNIPFQFILNSTYTFKKSITKIRDYNWLYKFTSIITEGQVNLQTR